MNRPAAPCLWLMVASLASPSLRGQESRDSLIARALTEFDAQRQVQMLITALNPSFGPPNGNWAAGVQQLAQTLIDQRRDSVAAVWLRWAIRLSPDLHPDTVEFLPRTALALRRARDFVVRTQGAGDRTTMTSWLWPAQGADEATGLIQVATSTVAGMQVSVDGVGRDPGGTAQLPPGSYDVIALAPGYDSVRVTREVLPSVTTVLRFQLHQLPAQAAALFPPSGTPGQAPVVSKGKRFPWGWAALGAAGAGTAAFFLLRHPTGSISITVPNPP